MRTPFFLHKSDLFVCRVSSEPSEREGHESDATKRGVSLRRESVNELKKRRFFFSYAPLSVDVRRLARQPEVDFLHS